VDGLLQKDLRELGAQDASRIMTQDSTLIGGYVITARGQRVDASYKRALLEMYHSLIRS
jgi:F0F1-type ATP synthase delta subunit